MAASVRNILHHKQTIERIRRDIAVIKEHYLPAQEPVLAKKQADIKLQIKMAQVHTSHYGTKPGHFETSKIHFPTSEGVSEVSERANE